MKSTIAPALLAFTCALVTHESIASAYQSSPTAAKPSKSPHSSSHAHDHEHEQGPNGGEILEVGKHEYHLELCLNEKTNLVTIYLLDRDLKKYIATNQPHLMCNFKENNKPVQIKLLPKPQKEDPKGASSCFEIADKRIIDALHKDNSDMRLVVRFGTKQYNVRVSHHHH